MVNQELYRQMRRKVLSRLEEVDIVTENQIRETIGDVVQKEEREKGFLFQDWKDYEVKLFNSLKKFDVIEELMEDEEVTEIMINGPNRIFYEKRGRMYPYSGKFESEQRLREIIDHIVGEHNRRVNTRTPIVDTRLADGSRVHVVLEPISLQGPVVTIRKFPPKMIGLDYLIAHDSLTVEAADFLRALVLANQTLLITGGTGSGKTTLLNALSEAIPSEERVITIEDSAELQLMELPNLVRLECRDANEEGVGAVTIRDLIKAAMRMRPTKIIIGEVRGPEALDLLQVFNTGHQGSLSSLHANTCKDAFSRLETMVLMAMDLPLRAVRAQIASGIQYIIHVKKYSDGSRKLDQMIRIDGLKGDEIQYHTIFQREGGVLKRVYVEEKK